MSSTVFYAIMMSRLEVASGVLLLVHISGRCADKWRRKRLGMCSTMNDLSYLQGQLKEKFGLSV